MRNKRIMHSRQEVEIYRSYYRPSFNLWRIFKSILIVLFFGKSTVAHTYIPGKKKLVR